MATDHSRNPCAASGSPVFERRLGSEAGSLVLRRYHCDVDSAIFGGLAPIASLWQAKRRGALLPRWRDFGIEEFVGWHRYLALSDIGAGKGDPRFRIFGSGMAEVIGVDLTGKRMSEVIQNLEQDGILQHFAEIRDRKLIGFLDGNLGRLGFDHRRFSAIELPLVKDTDKVEQILHAILPPSHAR